MDSSNTKRILFQQASFRYQDALRYIDEMDFDRILQAIQLAEFYRDKAFLKSGRVMESLLYLTTAERI